MSLLRTRIVCVVVSGATWLVAGGLVRLVRLVGLVKLIEVLTYHHNDTKLHAIPPAWSYEEARSVIRG